MRTTISPLLCLLFLRSAESINAPELPLCPTSISYLPQTLPMHCRMPVPKSPNPESGKSQKPVSFPPPIFQSPPPNKVPVPLPPGFLPPMLPPGMPMPPMGAIPAPVPIPMMGPPPQKLPVIVMPFYSPDTKDSDKDKDKRPTDDDCSSEETVTSDESCSDDDSNDSDHKKKHKRKNSDGYWKPGKKHKWPKRPYRRSFGGRTHRHSHRKSNLLTPVIQYVTKDGYVIFEKEITKVEAKDWLTSKKSEEEKEKEVSYRELDALKRSLGDDNEVVQVDLDEPKYIKPKPPSTTIKPMKIRNTPSEPSGNDETLYLLDESPHNSAYEKSKGKFRENNEERETTDSPSNMKIPRKRFEALKNLNHAKIASRIIQNQLP